MHRTNCLTYRCIRMLIAVACVWGLISCASVAAEDSNSTATPKKPWFEEWFEPELTESAMAGWGAQTLDLGWSQARVYTHTPAAKQHKNPKSLIAVLPKKSGSYPKAFNSLLTYIGFNFPGSTICLCNFGKNDENFKKVKELGVQRNADLFFTIGSESATAAAKFLVDLDIPVVTCNNKDPVILGLLEDPDAGSGTNIAYTTVNMTADGLYLWTLKFLPDLKQVGIVYDSQHKGVNAAEVQPLREFFTNNGITVLNVATTGPKNPIKDLSEVVPAAIETMKKEDPEFKASILLVTSCTSIWEQPAMGHLAKLAGKCPVVATVIDAVTGEDNGAMVGIGLDRGTAAHLAAVYAGRILSGKAKPQTMPLGRVSPPDIAISFLKAREAGVRIPFEFFENASFVYGYTGKRVIPPTEMSAVEK